MYSLAISTVGSFIISASATLLGDMYVTNRVSILGSFFGFEKTFNTGIAFGIQLPFQYILIVIALTVIGLLAVKTVKSQREGAGFGLILGGGIANIIDRAFDQTVTDFIQLWPFPIFNVADICINLGVVLLFYHHIQRRFGKKKPDKTVPVPAQEAPPGQTAANASPSPQAPQTGAADAAGQKPAVGVPLSSPSAKPAVGVPLQDDQKPQVGEPPSEGQKEVS